MAECMIGRREILSWVYIWWVVCLVGMSLVRGACLTSVHGGGIYSVGYEYGRRERMTRLRA